MNTKSEDNFEEEIEDKSGSKKKSKGRRRYRSISRTGMTVRLFNGSKMYIEKMVRELRFSDPNFATEAAAVRHYVNVGIAAETATSDLRNSLDNTIVKKSIKDGLRYELKSHSNHIENLINALKDFAAESNQLFNDISKRTELIESKVESGFENIEASVDSVLNLLKSNFSINEESLRNIIVLRTITYVFLLGHKTGKIAPGKENLVNWNRMIVLAHKKANELSMGEVKALASDVMEASIIQKMAREIFLQVNSLPEAKIE